MQIFEPNFRTKAIAIIVIMWFILLALYLRSPEELAQNRTGPVAIAALYIFPVIALFLAYKKYLQNKS